MSLQQHQSTGVPPLNISSSSTKNGAPTLPSSTHPKQSLKKTPSAILNEPGDGVEVKLDDSARRRELHKMFTQYKPKFLRNRLANLNLSQEGLKPRLVERLIDATLLLEKGVAPTQVARSTGQVIEIEAESASPQLNASDDFNDEDDDIEIATSTAMAQPQPKGNTKAKPKPGRLSGNPDVNDPLRRHKRRDTLQKYEEELAARPPPSRAQEIKEHRKSYASQKFHDRIAETHAGLVQEEKRHQAAILKKEETAKKIKEDQLRLERERRLRAEADEMARRRRIEMHGGIDPLQKKEKTREEKIQDIWDEIKDHTVKQLRNALALLGVSDKINVRLPGGDWDTRFLMRDGLLKRLHEKLIDERLGANDDVLVNALKAAGFDPGKKVFTKNERKRLTAELQRIQRERLEAEQDKLRLQLVEQRKVAKEQQRQRELAIVAARDAECAKVHHGMEVCFFFSQDYSVLNRATCFRC